MFEFHIGLTPTVDDVADARDGIEELSFDAVMGVANVSGIDIGSDEFLELYKELSESYKNAAEYLTYFLHLGLLALKTQLETGVLAITLTSPDEADAGRRLMEAAKPIAACLLHAAATADRMALSIADLEDFPADVLQVKFDLAGRLVPKETLND
jgi:hypothetical protein